MATVGPTNLPAFFNVDADFRTWGSTISSALATLGLVQTADTGQINWATVLKPSASSTSQGYEVWRFNDTLQATAPVFLKIEYGSSSAASNPGLWVTVGSGSNGSGTLTGQVGTRASLFTSAVKTAGVTLPCYVSGNSGEMVLAFNYDSAATAFAMVAVVERPKDNNDSTTAEGVVHWNLCANALQVQFIPATGTIPGQVNSAGTPFPAVNPNYFSRSSSGANVDVCPVFIPMGGVWRYSHLNVHKSGDLAGGGSYSTTLLGAAHTYMSLDAPWTAASVNGATAGFSFRWE